MGNLKNEKLLIFIVVYNAENYIENVLNRIPQAVIDRFDYEVLIIDDHSKNIRFKKLICKPKQESDKINYHIKSK